MHHQHQAQAAREIAQAAAYRAPTEIFTHGAPQSQAEVMVEVATHICISGRAYAHEGRGPWAYDDLGLARFCAQAAIDWQVFADAQKDGREARYGDPIPDFIDYAPTSWRSAPAPLENMLRDWGMERIGTGRHVNVLKDAIPGDMIVFMGRGPRLGIVVAPWSEGPKWPHFLGPVIATVREGQPPAASREVSMGWHPLSLCRWPEAAR